MPIVESNPGYRFSINIAIIQSHENTLYLSVEGNNLLVEANNLLAKATKKKLLLQCIVLQKRTNPSLITN